MPLISPEFNIALSEVVDINLLICIMHQIQIQFSMFLPQNETKNRISFRAVIVSSGKWWD